jgi:hypothetical protein
MGRADLIGNGKQHLIPTFQPLVDGSYQSARKKNSTSSKAAAASGYTTNKDGKAVAVRRAAKRRLEPKGDVRFRSSQPNRALLTQHTGLPPRAGVGKKRGRQERCGREAAGAKRRGQCGAGLV